MHQPLGDQHQNLIYLYDLPKEDISCKKIAEAFKAQADVHLDIQPQIRRDLTRPFYSAIVNIKDPVQFEKACKAMRYFEINGKQCRALQFDKQLLGTNKEKLATHNVFIKNIGKDMKHQDLQGKFEKLGNIKSLKISLNPDHSSRGYGFICFQDEDTANAACAESENHDDAVAVKFEPKDRRSLKKLKNNIYVKNIPLDMNDQQIKQLFEPYGTIKSLYLQKNAIGQFGFVCYDDPNNMDKDYGPECAQKAIDELNNTQLGDEGAPKLYVRHAMTKSEREIEKKKDTIRYKASKKRCNLYVKNFPAAWSEDDLKQQFSQFGQIEKIRLEPKGKAGNSFAFVCYKTPDSAASAKQMLHNQTFDGKALIINHYEIKEFRQIQKEEAIDKADFERYQQQQTGGFHLNDLTSHPYLAQILQQLIEIMHQNEAMNAHFNQSERNVRPQRPQQRYNNPRYQNQNQNMQGNMHHQNKQNMGGPGPQGMPVPPQNQSMGMPQQPMAGGMPMAPPQQQNMGAGMPGIPAQPMAGGMNNQQRVSLTPQQRYAQAAQKIIPSCSSNNPYLKEQVGSAIFEFVTMIVPQEKAPKITGMLIELPVDQIKAYLQDYAAFINKVNEADELIKQAEKQGINAGQPQ